MLVSMFTFNYFRINTFTIDVDVIIEYEIFADSHLKHLHRALHPPTALNMCIILTFHLTSNFSA